MDSFHYHNNELFAEKISLNEVAKKFGTPCFVYSKSTLEKNWRAFDTAFRDFPHLICYAVKANSNLAILNLFAKMNSGFDIVSVGELERVLAAGANPKKIVFSGIGKRGSEIVRALEVGIKCFDVESESELERIQQIAALQNKIADITLRINPNIDARTHPYIATGLNENKFGIELAKALPISLQIKKMPNLRLVGIACHIGSQLTEIEPFTEALDCMLDLVNKLSKESITLQHINMGGGLGINYRDETPPNIQAYATAVREKLANTSLELILEPGRAIVADAGILLTRIEYLKHNHHKNFAIVDAAMNDYIRPALYDAWQKIIPVRQNNEAAETLYDIVGPVCESADFLGKNRQLAVQAGDLLAVCDAGAYGFSMSSNYNSRPRAAEVMVDGDNIFLIRKRETIKELFALEHMM